MSGSNKWSLKSSIPCVLEFWVLFSANRSRRKKEEVKMCRRKTLCSRNGAPEALPNWEGSGVDSKVGWTAKLGASGWHCRRGPTPPKTEEKAHTCHSFRGWRGRELAMLLRKRLVTGERVGEPAWGKGRRSWGVCVANKENCRNTEGLNRLVRTRACATVAPSPQGVLRSSRWCIEFRIIIVKTMTCWKRWHKPWGGR